MAKTDATVTTEDLIRANEEVSKIRAEESALSMRQLEPVLVDYVESAAGYIEQRILANPDRAKAAKDAAYLLRKLSLTVLRARDLGYHRLWKNAFAEFGPLANTVNEDAEDEGDEDESEGDSGENEKE